MMPHSSSAIRRTMLALSVVTVAALTTAAAQQAAPATAAAAPTVKTGADSLLEARTRNLSAQLRCPVCQGLSLQDSPSELSQQMRDVVRGQLAMGKSDDEVKAYFVARYGEWILMEPEARGFNLLVYVLPFVGLLAGAGVLVLAVRRWTRTSPGDPSTAAVTSDAVASDAVASESESEVRA
jgi:cytochrome c-type biogenesis protein CcmH